MGAVRKYKVFSHYSIVNTGYETPCWLWRGPRSEKGYAVTNRSGTNVKDKVHKLYYEKFIGPVPEDLELDHLCCMKHCINPYHLEPVTHIVNLRRAVKNGRISNGKSKIISSTILAALKNAGVIV